MGARWPWRAWCANGHEFSGFSGGSDGHCEVGDCQQPIVREIQEPFPDEPQGDVFPDPLITRLQEQQAVILDLQTALGESEQDDAPFIKAFRTKIAAGSLSRAEQAQLHRIARHRHHKLKRTEAKLAAAEEQFKFAKEAITIVLKKLEHALAANNKER